MFDGVDPSALPSWAAIDSHGAVGPTGSLGPWFTNTIWPMPRHILEDLYRTQGVDAIANSPWWTSGFVGTGPFKVVSWDQDVELVLEANELSAFNTILGFRMHRYTSSCCRASESSPRTIGREVAGSSAVSTSSESGNVPSRIELRIEAERSWSATEAVISSR